MAFELGMSLPHIKRVKQLDGQGEEEYALDQDLWDLHAVVQKAVQDKAAGGAAGQEQEPEEGAAGALRKPTALPNPQRVLEKLLTARGEVDVILDLVSFVEQQQFLGVAHLPRRQPSLADLARDRALRLARRSQQLRACSSRLAGGLEALRAQSEVSSRFLGEVAELRKRWNLKRHSGKDGFFYVDLALPLAPSARKAVGEQPGCHWNLLQDTNGDVCLVDRPPGGGRAFAVRGWRGIHKVLQAKQRALTWRAVRALLAHEAEQAQQGQQAQQSMDPDGLAPLLVQLADAARECSEREAAAAAGGAAARGAAGAADGPSAMEVDDAVTALDAPLPLPTAHPDVHSMQSAMARDVRALLRTPGFQEHFQARALALLGGYLRGAGGAGAPERPQQPPQQQLQLGVGMAGRQGEGSAYSLLDGLLAWLRHRAVCHRVEASLRRQVASASGGQPGGGAAGGAGPQRGTLGMLRLATGSASVEVWQLQREGSAAGPALLIVCEGTVRVEGPLAGQSGAGEAEPGACWHLGRGKDAEHIMSLLP